MPSTRQIQFGGQPSYCPANRLLAFARRSPAGWQEVYTCRRDGTAEQNITHNIDFWTGIDGAPANTIRHVGLPHWSIDGQWMLLSVERWNVSNSSNNAVDHLSEQPGRGIFNDIWILNMRDKKSIARLVKYDLSMGGVVGGGTMHAYFSPDQSKVAFSRFKAAGGTYGNWDIGYFNMTLADGNPNRGAITIINPSDLNNPGANHMNEVNSWKLDGTGVHFSGNPVLSQTEGSMDVCATDLGVTSVVRYSYSSGQNGETAKYQEHIVVSPHGSKVAWMGNDFKPAVGGSNGPVGTEVYWETYADGTLVGNTRTQLTHFNVSGHPDYLPPQNGTITAPTGLTTGRPDWYDESTIVVDVHAWDNGDGLYSGQGPIMLIEGVDRMSRYYSFRPITVQNRTWRDRGVTKDRGARVPLMTS